jgi:hypothetical protein
MNKVSGKVILKESGVGIPDLLVVIYDLDPNTKSEEVLGNNGLIVGGSTSTLALLGQGFPGDRLGSVLTDQNGAFALAFEDDEFRIRNEGEKRPDLFIIVIAPEELGIDTDSRILFTSSAIRQNAGRTEQYVIQITSDQLTKAGIPLPAPQRSPLDGVDQVVERIQNVDKRRIKIEEAVNGIALQRFNKIRTRHNDFEAKLKPSLLRAISRVPEKLEKTERSRFVSPEESVSVKNIALIKHGLEKLNTNARNGRTITSYISLTDEQRDLVQSKLDNNKEITAEDLNTILVQSETNLAIPLLHESPLDQFCRLKSSEQQQAETLLSLSNSAQPSPSQREQPSRPTGDQPGDGVTLDSADDVNRFVARLMETMTTPEEAVVGGLTPRSTLANVYQNVDGLFFNKGPADTPAFHEFHNLQIAFEHVWQEAIDEGALRIDQSAYNEIVELGIEPQSKQEFLTLVAVMAGSHPPADVIGEFGISNEQWIALPTDLRNELEQCASDIKDSIEYVNLQNPSGELSDDAPVKLLIRSLRQRAQRILDYADTLIIPDNFDNIHRVLRRLQEFPGKQYPFTIYAADSKERSVNFGIVVTYLQRWEPLGYQAGELVRTITLAPKQTIKFMKKVQVNHKRSEKEAIESLTSRKDELNDTMRAEQEIVDKASAKTNFSLASQGSYDIGISEGSVNTKFGKESSTNSDEVKKDFHEAVVKASQEYKLERKTEVLTELTEDTTIEETSEITNPNDELAVTFLFYELQRRYKVVEQIHRLMPVVLVAQEVPNPGEIDNAWLIAHDWILRRVILDDQFIPAMNYLSTRCVGEDLAIKEMRKNVEQQRRLTDELKEDLVSLRGQVARRSRALDQAIDRQAGIAAKGNDGFLENLAEDALSTSVLDEVAGFFFGGDGENAESARIRREAAEKAYLESARQERELASRLQQEVSALNQMTIAYTKALSQHLNELTQVARLRVHVIQNILYYMQAIWSHEPPDQRFFRLFNVRVPTLRTRVNGRRFTFENLTAPNRAVLAFAPHRNIPFNNQKPVSTYPVKSLIELDTELEFITLEEAADLDNLLGFKGNYMIFPLKESNKLSDFMMDPYIDRGLNALIDPDDLGNWTLDEFAQYVVCLKQELSNEQFVQIRDDLANQYKQLLTAPRRNGEEITIPTNSLFIEALPASHSLIEEFKARHRAIDVKKVQAEVREMELENIRRAARILAGEREDPDIEKKVVVQGTASVIVPNDD